MSIKMQQFSYNSPNLLTCDCGDREETCQTPWCLYSIGPKSNGASYETHHPVHKNTQTKHYHWTYKP